MENIVEHFRENGWFILDLIDPSSVYRTRAFLTEKLSELLGRPCPLEDYHLHAENDTVHTQLQIQMTEFFRKEKWGPQIIRDQLPFFQKLLGPDLFVQADPYLRMTRPQKPQDNIGYHRDTFYGGSPYELSVLIPFVDVPKASALKVLSGSHVHSESLYPTEQILDPTTTKGSSKHQLGFLYAPKQMDSSIEEKMEPIPLQIGQALVFSLSTVHGSRVNTGDFARWSTDIRVMHAMAPVDLSARPHYYQPLSDSIVTQKAKEYFYANREKARDDVELELCHPAP